MLLVEKNSLYMCYETCPMTPTMSTISKIRELKERAIYKLTLRYGRPFVVFLNTPRLAGAIGSRPENGNKQIPASVQQLTRAIRSDGVSLEDITRYAKLADSMQSMRMDSDELKGLLRAGRAGSGRTWGQTLSSAVGLGGPPADSGDPIENIDTLRAQVQGLKNDLRACETADNREQLQQAMQKLLECEELVTQLSQRIEDLNKKLQEERAKNERLTRQLSAEGQAKEREKKRLEDLRRAAEEQRRQEAAAVTTRVRDRLAAERLAAGRLEAGRLEAGRRSADQRGKKKSDGVVRRGFDFDRVGSVPVKDDEEETKEDTKADECTTPLYGTPEGTVSLADVQGDPERAKALKSALGATAGQGGLEDASAIIKFLRKYGEQPRATKVGPLREQLKMRFIAEIQRFMTENPQETVLLNWNARFSTLNVFGGGGRSTYCPIKSIDNEGTVTFDKSGTRTEEALKLGAREFDSIYVPKNVYETYREKYYSAPAATEPVRRSARNTPQDTPPEPVGTAKRAGAVDRFAGIKGKDDLSDSAPDSDDEEEDMDIPSGDYFPEADLPKIKELVRLSEVPEKDLQTKLNKLSNYIKGNLVWVVYNGNVYRPENDTIELPSKTTKGNFTRSSNIKSKLRNSAAGRAGGYYDNPLSIKTDDEESTFEKIVVIAAKWQQTPSAPAAPTRAAPTPVETTTVRRSTRSGAASTRSTPVDTTPARQSSTSGKRSLDPDNMTYKQLQKWAKKNGKAYGVKGNSKGTDIIAAIKKSQGRSLMERIEDFEGVDGVVPALPSIRIPERHEM